jgi:hypothetical protein
MKEKHIKIRIQQCLALSGASECPRRKFGALLVDPTTNVLLIDGALELFRFRGRISIQAPSKDIQPRIR